MAIIGIGSESSADLSNVSHTCKNRMAMCLQKSRFDKTVLDFVMTSGTLIGSVRYSTDQTQGTMSLCLDCGSPLYEPQSKTRRYRNQKDMQPWSRRGTTTVETKGCRSRKEALLLSIRVWN